MLFAPYVLTDQVGLLQLDSERSPPERMDLFGHL